MNIFDPSCSVVPDISDILYNSNMNEAKQIFQVQFEQCAKSIKRFNGLFFMFQ